MLLSVMAGFDVRDPLSIMQDPQMLRVPLQRDLRGTRIAWMGDLGGYLPTEPGVLGLCRTSLRAFELIGCNVEEARPAIPPEQLWRAWLTLRHWLSAEGLRDLYGDPVKRAMLKPEIRWEIEGGLPLSAHEVHQASRLRSDWYSGRSRTVAAA